MPVSVETYWAPDPIVAAQELNQTADTLEDFTPALFGAREVIVRDINSHFEKQSDPSGKAWQEWSRNYKDVAERKNIGGILQQTLEMQKAVTDRQSWMVTGHEVFANTTMWPERWAWHQAGANRSIAGSERIAAELKAAGFSTEGIGENILPARPFIGISEDAEFEIFDILDEFVDSAFAVAIHPTTGFAQRRVGGRFGSAF